MTDFACNVSADLFRRALSCVSTEQTRYYLGGVQIEPCAQGGVLLVSTDDHRLIALRDPTGSADGTAIISAESSLTKALGDKRAETLIVAENRANVAGAGNVPLYRGVADCEIDGTFPDWRRVIPNLETPARPDKEAWPRMVGAYNANLLNGIAKALAPIGKAAPSVDLYADDMTSPILVYGSAQDIDGFGVLMPIRSGRSPFRPSWLERPPVVVADETEAAA